MKKKIIAVILICLAVLAIIANTVFAMEGSGISVMQSDVELIKTAIKGQTVVFSDKDFKSALAIADFKSITLGELPASTEGTLFLGGRRVSEGQTVKRRQVGGLSFVPASSEVTVASFTVTVNADRSVKDIPCTVKFIDRVNSAPEREDGSVSTFSTQASIPYYGTLYGNDPEGDELCYMVVGYPKYGSLTLDSASGEFSYSPTDGFTGNDSFTYVIRDCYGNYTKPEEVKISVIERMNDQIYVDMQGRAEYNAAVAICSMGITTPTRLGDDLYFNPEEAVTKSEFVAMAMKAYGIKADSTLKQSFFDDNGDIPSSLVGYVATAARLGIIDGELVDGKLLFSPTKEINGYEAAVILARLMNTAQDEESAEYQDEQIPVWARGSVSTMYTLGVFDKSTKALGESVTRADLAEYLYRMIKNS